jgi:hypothetical protein
MHELEPEKVEKTKALAALDKILASEEFAASPQLASFLTFSVRRTLDGQGPALKAYTIATEVLSRPPTFDPQNDPIVRVEATRLRRALDRYYANDGAGDDLKITMPRGGYSVTFNKPKAGHETARQGKPDKAPREKRTFSFKMPLIIIALFIATTAAATIIWKERLNIFAERSNPATSTPSAPSNEPATLSLPNPSKATGAPKLAYWKPRLAAFSVSTDSTATNLMHEIGDILSHFDGMMVFDETAMVDQIADDLYQLDGRAKSGKPDQIDIRLIHTASHRTAFVRTITLPKDEDATQELAKKIAILIGGRDGIVITDPLPARTDELAKPINPRTCLSITNAAIRSHDSGLMITARACLDDILKQASNSSMLLSLSADLRRLEKQGDAAIAEKEAQLALALDPHNVRAMHVLSELVDAKNPGLALRLGDMAVDLNPYDPVISQAQAKRLRAAGLTGRAARLQAELFGVE